MNALKTILRIIQMVIPFVFVILSMYHERHNDMQQAILWIGWAILSEIWSLSRKVEIK